VTDYTRGVGNGTMMIRDTGGWVEFWFQTGSSTYSNDQTWGYDIGNGFVGGKYRLARGGAWQMFGNAYVDTRRNVTFHIDDFGLGWATTDFTVFIERARVPDPPTTPSIGERTDTQIHAWFDANYDGGTPIRQMQLFVNGPGAGYWLQGRDVWFGNLYPGTDYEIFGQVRNDIGWSAYGGSTRTRTLRIPDAPNPVMFDNPQQMSVVIDYNYSGRWDGGAPVQEWQVGYGLDPNNPQAYVGGVRQQISNLQPGRQYFFWARGRNQIGWSPWSQRSQVTLNAGALVRDGGTYKRAVPWVKVNGIWRVAKPWTKDAGNWRAAKS
jgi:hypothetical protein